MIVSHASGHTATVTPGGARIDRRCLARRGMVHSECEAFDHVVLSPGCAVELQGRDGADEVWFVLDGELVQPALAGARPVRPGQVLLRREHEDRRLVAGAAGVRCLVLAVLPNDRIGRLPVRKPEVAHD